MFTTLDYVVLFAYLAASALLGTLVGRGQRTTSDYFLGNRRMPWWAISFSIVATETSTLTFIGAPAIAYSGNLTFMQVVVGYFLGRLLVAWLLIPSYFRGRLETAYQLLQYRFGWRVRTFAACLFLGTRTLADGVRLFATALVLGVVTGLDDLWTVAIIGLVTLAYTFYGGMRAVVWNDVAQLIIYLLGATLAFVLILERVPGGWAGVAALAAPAGKFQWIDWSLNLSLAYTFWAGLIGGAFVTFATHGTDQMMVQRYLACGTRRGSQAALVLSGILVLGQFLLFLLIGVMLFVFYRHFPLAQEPEQVNRIFPLFIVREMPAGVSGLVIAAIFAAAMSTLSSSLNSLASSSLNDFYRPARPGAAESHYLKASRLLTLLWGVMLIAVSLLARNWGEVLQAGLTITSLTMGCVLGVFLLALGRTRPSEGVALGAMAAGLGATLLAFWSGQVAWTWNILIGSGVTVLVGLIARGLREAKGQAD